MTSDPLTHCECVSSNNNNNNRCAIICNTIFSQTTKATAWKKYVIMSEASWEGCALWPAKKLRRQRRMLKKSPRIDRPIGLRVRTHNTAQLPVLLLLFPCILAQKLRTFRGFMHVRCIRLKTDVEEQLADTLENFNRPSLYIPASILHQIINQYWHCLTDMFSDWRILSGCCRRILSCCRILHYSIWNNDVEEQLEDGDMLEMETHSILRFIGQYWRYFRHFVDWRTLSSIHHQFILFFVFCRHGIKDVKEQLEDGDALLKCFSPLFNSMRLFGIYFTRGTGRIHDVSGSTTAVASRKWTGGHIYAVVIMVVLWLNAIRVFSAFNKADNFGVTLLVKLTMVSGALLSAVLQTGSFVACHTGNLDRVFRDAKLPKSDHTRYRRLAVIHTIVCWVRLVAEMLVGFVPLLLALKYWDLSMTPFGVHVDVSDEQILLIKLLMVLLYLPVYAGYTFPYSVNYIIDYIRRSYSVSWLRKSESILFCKVLMFLALHLSVKQQSAFDW